MPSPPVSCCYRKGGARTRLSTFARRLHWAGSGLPRTSRRLSSFSSRRSTSLARWYVSTVGATSAADAARDARRPPQRYGRIVVVGGGCYGGYYVRQLLRAERAGALTWDELVVVDRDPSCAVSALPIDDRPPRLRLVESDWHEFFAQYLASAAAADTES